MSSWQVRIVCVGRLKARYFEQAQEEYRRLLQRYCRMEIVELAEVVPKGSGPKAEQRAREEEAKHIVQKLRGFIIALDPRGRRMDSLAFSQLLMHKRDRGQEVTFVIGGSTGLDASIREHADLVVSFSDFTMPHHLFRIVLLEQIYRAMKIGAGETYHK